MSLCALIADGGFLCFLSSGPGFYENALLVFCRIVSCDEVFLFFFFQRRSGNEQQLEWWSRTSRYRGGKQRVAIQWQQASGIARECLVSSVEFLCFVWVSLLLCSIPDALSNESSFGVAILHACWALCSGFTAVQLLLWNCCFFVFIRIILPIRFCERRFLFQHDCFCLTGNYCLDLF